VALREQEEEFPASEPQISSAPAVVRKWQELLEQAPASRLLASTLEWPDNPEIDDATRREIQQ
jgi:hypothetical protein